MDSTDRFNDWVMSAIKPEDLPDNVKKFKNLMNKKYNDLLNQGFVYRSDKRGGIFSPEKRKYEMKTKFGSFVGFSPGLNNESKYLRDIFNKKTLKIIHDNKQQTQIYLFAYEAPILRIKSEKDVRFRVSADLIGVNDKGEIVVIETKLSGGDPLDQAVTQAFGYAFFLSLHLSGPHRDKVIQHAQDCMEKFHGHDKLNKKIMKNKIKYMVAAPYQYFNENLSNTHIAKNLDSMINNLENKTENLSLPKFGGFLSIDNVFFQTQNINLFKNQLSQLSQHHLPCNANSFSEEEKRHQVFLKKEGFFSDNLDCTGLGEYRKYMVDYCLTKECKKHNIYGNIRHCVYEYFKDKSIKFHSLGENHLLSSQAFCLNFLFPFRKDPNALKIMLAPLFPDIKDMMPIENNSYIAFEWNHGKDYLNEQGGRVQTRGEYATYPDAAIKYLSNENTCKVVLIEWKYTESYSSEDKSQGSKGNTRIKTYAPFFKQSNCPINLRAIDENMGSSIKALFFEPFYQLCRQQLLAHAMEEDDSNDIHHVSVLHICPKENLNYHNNVTSSVLADVFLEKSVLEIWAELLNKNKKDRFKSVDQKYLFEQFSTASSSDFYREWKNYMAQRYCLDKK